MLIKLKMEKYKTIDFKMLIKYIQFWSKVYIHFAVYAKC